MKQRQWDALAVRVSESHVLARVCAVRFEGLKWLLVEKGIISEHEFCEAINRPDVQLSVDKMSKDIEKDLKEVKDQE